MACRARMRPSRWACHPRSGRGGSGRLAGCRHVTLAPVSGRYLSFAEREEIAILRRPAAAGSARSLGGIGRSPSTISRELRRNASTRSNELTYRATTAQWHAERRASRPKVAKLAANDRLRDYVQDRLAGDDRTTRR